MNVNPNASSIPPISTQAAYAAPSLVCSDQTLEKEVRAVLGYGNAVSIVGEWPADSNRNQELIDDIRATLSRMCNQGTGDGYSLTVVANPRGNSVGAAALGVARDLGMKTLAIVNDCDVLNSEGEWDHQIVVMGANDDVTLMPECSKDIFGRMTHIGGRQSVLLAYGGGLESMAEAWSDYQPVFFEDKFMSRSDADRLKDEFLKKTYIRRMEFAHRNGYELGNDDADQPWFFDKNDRREDEQFRPDERHWFVKLSDFLGFGKNRWTQARARFFNH